MPPHPVNSPRRPWWHNQAMPWNGTPTRAEKWCWAMLGVITLYGLILAPLRAAMPTWNLYLWASVTGSSLSMITLGAFSQVGNEPWWWLGIAAATLTMIKFNIVYWLAGRLWGTAILERFAGRTEWARANTRRATTLTARYGWLAIIAMHFIPVIPVIIVCIVAGLSGMRARTFLLWNLLGSFISRVAFYLLGFAIGQPVISVFRSLERGLTYASYVLLAVVIAYVWIMVRRHRSNSR